MSHSITPSESIRRALTASATGLVERESLLELVVLCAVAEEHLLVIGPAGTGKSEAVRRIAGAFGGRYFEYLLGRFTEPSEIFGPVDLRRLREGVVETETRGMLPEAEIAFLDEVFLGSTAILNTLLGILNERKFRRGHTMLDCPLRVCVGAANRLPEEQELAAFADRFLVRVFVSPVPETRLEDLLHAGWALRPDLKTHASMDDLRSLSRVARAMNLDAVRGALAHAVRQLRGAGITLSDRRIVRMQHLVAAAAAVAGHTEASITDLWPIVFVLPSEQAQEIGRETLRDVLRASENRTLPSAALEASLGLAARATKIAEEGQAILSARPTTDADASAWMSFRLRVEGLAREIDATFPKEALGPELARLRAQVVEVLSQTPEPRA